MIRNERPAASSPTLSSSGSRSRSPPCRIPPPNTCPRHPQPAPVPSYPAAPIRRAKRPLDSGCISPQIEHRLISAISMNWRVQPLTGHEVIVNIIAGTTTFTGLTVTSELDDTIYPKSIKITDREMADLETQHLTRHDFHGECNYSVSPAT